MTTIISKEQMDTAREVHDDGLRAIQELSETVSFEVARGGIQPYAGLLLPEGGMALGFHCDMDEQGTPIRQHLYASLGSLGAYQDFSNALLFVCEGWERSPDNGARTGRETLMTLVVGWSGEDDALEFESQTIITAFDRTEDGITFEDTEIVENTGALSAGLIAAVGLLRKDRTTSHVSTIDPRLNYVQVLRFVDETSQRLTGSPWDIGLGNEINDWVHSLFEELTTEDIEEQMNTFSELVHSDPEIMDHVVEEAMEQSGLYW